MSCGNPCIIRGSKSFRVILLQLKVDEAFTVGFANLSKKVVESVMGWQDDHDQLS